MAIKHIPDGQDFEHPADFGFTGSAKGHRGKGVSKSPDAKMPVSTMEHGPADHEQTPPDYHNVVVTDEHGSGPPDAQSQFGHGGHHMPHMHPHGHEVMHVEHHPHGVMHHHAHGGMTMHHHDGSITHHDHMGMPIAHHSAHHMAHGGHPGMMQDESTHVGKMARGGHKDMAQDKAMVAKGIHQHEDHEHHGEHTDLHLARGNRVPNSRPRLPRGMKPTSERPHSPVGKPPAMTAMRTPMGRNRAPGGPMDLGVEPSAEPDVAGSDQDLGGALSHGGHMGRRRRHHED